MALLSRMVFLTGPIRVRDGLTMTGVLRLLAATIAGGGVILVSGGPIAARAAHSAVFRGDGSRSAIIVRLTFGHAATRRGRVEGFRRETVEALCRRPRVVAKAIAITGHCITVTSSLRGQRRLPPIFWLVARIIKRVRCRIEANCRRGL